MSRARAWTPGRVALLVVAVLLVPLCFVVVELDARRVWQRCQHPDFAFPEIEARLRDEAWVVRVHCTDGSCSWRSLHNRWACHVVDDGGRARPGGSG